MEAQGWWFATNNDAGGTDTGKSQGHVHVASCLPEWRTNDTANKITSRYLTVHVRVDIHLKSGVPAELSTRRVDEVQMTEMSFRGVDEGAGNELVDRFEGMPQSVLDCDRGERCAWYFLFSGTNQSASPSCSVFTDNESATDRSAYCTAPQLDLYNSQRDGTCIRGNPTDECPGYEENATSSFGSLLTQRRMTTGRTSPRFAASCARLFGSISQGRRAPRMMQQPHSRFRKPPAGGSTARTVIQILGRAATPRWRWKTPCSTTR